MQLEWEYFSPTPDLTTFRLYGLNLQRDERQVVVGQIRLWSCAADGLSHIGVWYVSMIPKYPGAAGPLSHMTSEHRLWSGTIGLAMRAVYQSSEVEDNNLMYVNEVCNSSRWWCWPPHCPLRWGAEPAAKKICNQLGLGRCVYVLRCCLLRWSDRFIICWVRAGFLDLMVIITAQFRQKNTYTDVT